jgi:hypothetical protein
MEGENPFFRLLGGFLFGSGDTRIVRYCGNERGVVVSNTIESISAGCFNDHDSVLSLSFEFDCGVESWRELLASIHDHPFIYSNGWAIMFQILCESDMRFASSCQLSVVGETGFE